MKRIVASEDYMHELWNIGNDMTELLDANDISHTELWNYKMFANSSNIAVIDIYIEGDWKHDHLYANDLLEENFPILRINEAVTEDTGEDWFPAVHSCYIDLRDYRK